MKLKTVGRIALASAVSVGSILGMTSCVQSYTVGYLYVTGSQYGQIGTYKIDHDTGRLTQVGPLVTSRGTDPIQAIVAPGGRFLYVLTNGCGPGFRQACAAGTANSTEASSINLFAIGGSGVLTYQTSYHTQGTNTVTIALNSAGTAFYALDNLAPDGSGQGDITAYTVDGATGRLTLITNQQSTNPQTGLNLNYFKVGTNPTWFALSSTGGFLYTVEQGPAGAASPSDPQQAVFLYATGTNGQLTLTQNAPLPTGAAKLTFIQPGGGFVYLLDAGQPNTVGSILPYTAGANGALQSVTNGIAPNTAQGNQSANPTVLTTFATSPNNFLYVANAGPNLAQNTATSSVTQYLIQPSTTGSAGELTPVAGASATSLSGLPAGARCLVIDPTNQYLYTVGNNSTNGGNIAGYALVTTAGSLRNLTKGIGNGNGPGNATWCVVSGTTF